MAPLTWRNIDAPNFSGANDMWRVAANLLNKGFDSASKGLEDFRNISQQDASAKLMADVIAAGGDQNAIKAAVQGVNPAYISPQALSFANAQPGVLLERQGTGLNNAIKSQNIKVGEYNFDRTKIDNQRKDAAYEQLPDALSALSALRTDMASTDPKVVAGIPQRQAELFSKYGRALGLNSASDLSAAQSGNYSGANQQFQYASGMENAIRGKDADNIVNNALGFYQNDPDAAIRGIQGISDLDIKTKTAVIEKLNAAKAALPQKTSAQSALEQSQQARGQQPDSRFPSVNSIRDIGTRTNNPLSALVDRTEGAGNYSTLYGHKQKNEFAGVDVSQQTIGDLKQFASKNGAYGRSQINDLGKLATPMGRYQIVGATLASTAKEMGLPDTTVFTPQVQDAMFDYIASKAISGPRTMEGKLTALRGQWEGFKSVPDGVLANAVRAYETGDKTALNPATLQQGTVGGPLSASISSFGSPSQSNQYRDFPIPYESPINSSKAQIINNDGIVSTERTTTFQNDNGNWVNVPTIVNGKQLSVDDAIKEYLDGNNKPTGIFGSQKQAEDAAQARSDEIGRQIDESNNSPVKMQEQATAASNQALNDKLTPTIPETEEVKVSDTNTIPAVDKSASAFKQDAQRRTRTESINSAIGDIQRNLQSKEGGSTSFLKGASSAWDYFMETPEKGAANAASRAEATKVSEWYGTETARNYFQNNPQELAKATADPIAYSNNFGKTPDQKAVLDKQAATIAAANVERAKTASQKQAEETPQRRPPTTEELINREIAATGGLSTLNEGLDNASQLIAGMQAADKKKSRAEIASDLTKSGAAYEKYSLSSVTSAIKEIEDATGANPAVAAVLLKKNAIFSEPGAFRSFFGAKGEFDIDIDQAKKDYKLFNNGDGKGGASPGISLIAQAAATEDADKKREVITKNYQDNLSKLKSALVDPATTPAQQIAIQKEIEALQADVLIKLKAIRTSGDTDNNLRVRKDK